MDMDLGESMDLAHVAQEHMRTTQDHKEAVQAFIDKRPPNFIGK
jgi:enoyl-CoA hydratase/carnithine racemase